MSDDVSKTMDDLVEYLLCEIEKRGLPNDEFRMQKLIFKIKMELGKDHELYPKLPFYWYLKGPYSPVVTKSYEAKLPPSLSESQIQKDYPEIIDISQDIFEKKEYFMNEIDKDIYRQYAPYKFMYLYKYKIYDVAKATEEVGFDSKDFIRVLTSCEGTLPIDEYFFKFNEIFGRLFTNIELIRRADNFEKYWNLLQNPLILTWKTFAKGIRVCFKDNYYTNNIKSWDKEFKTSLDELSILVEKTCLLINYDDYPKNNYSPDEINVTLNHWCLFEGIIMLILEHHMSDTNILLAMILQNDASYKEVKEYLKTQYLRYVSENTKKEAEFKISNIRNISLHVSEM